MTNVCFVSEERQKDVSLDVDCYEAFYSKLVEVGYPSYLQCSFLGHNVHGEVKICMDVNFDKKNAMLAFLHEQFPGLSEKCAFDVIEQPRSVMSTLAAEGSNIQFLFSNEEVPGTTLPTIQGGSFISVVAASEVQSVDEIGPTFKRGMKKESRTILSGTLGAIMINRKDKQLYGITARHVLHCKNNNDSKVHTFCKVNWRREKPLIHLGAKYVAPNDAKVDIAAIPIVQTIQLNRGKYLEVFLRNSMESVVKVKPAVVTKDSFGTSVSVKGARSFAQGKIINNLCDVFPISGKPHRKCFQVGYGGLNAVVVGDSGALVTDAIGDKRKINAYGTLIAVINEDYFNRGDGKTYPSVSVNQCFETGIRALNQDCGLDLQFCSVSNIGRISSAVRVKSDYGNFISRRNTVE